jgi:hypothetical protein
MITSTVDEKKKITPGALAGEAIAEMLNRVGNFIEDHPEIESEMTEEEFKEYRRSCSIKRARCLGHLRIDWRGRKETH